MNPKFQDYIYIYIYHQSKKTHSSYIRNFADFQLGNSHPHGHQNELAPPPCRIQYLEMAVEITAKNCGSFRHGLFGPCLNCVTVDFATLLIRAAKAAAAA